jgi:3-isopropylmalate dehydrogenase
MLLAYQLRLDKEAEAVERAIVKTLEQGYRTKDIQGPGTKLVGTKEMGDAVLRNFLQDR